MPILSESRIEELLAPYLNSDIPTPSGPALATVADTEKLFSRLSLYLDLLVRWNERTNLTSIRSPELMVQRHFGESIFAARIVARLVPDASAVLDFGSGAGFPGLPTSLLLPELKVTLAESQSKKVAFLREAIRLTGSQAEVWSGRVEAMSRSAHFDLVCARAVDDPLMAAEEASRRVRLGGWLLSLESREPSDGERVKTPGTNSGFVTLRRG